MLELKTNFVKQMIALFSIVLVLRPEHNSISLHLNHKGM